MSEFTINGRYYGDGQQSNSDLIAPWPDEPEECFVFGVKYRKQLAWVEVKE